MNLKSISVVALALLFSALAFGQGNYEKGDILVKFKPGVVNFAQGLSQGLANGSNFEVIGNDWVHIKVAPAQLSAFGSDEDLLASLRANPNVVYAQPNYHIHLIEDYTQNDPKILEAARTFDKGHKFHFKSKPAIPTAVITPMFGPDPLVGEQWSMKTIGAVEAWKTQRGNKKIIVAVIDTGVDYTHEDLVGNIWHNPNEIDNNGIDDDQNGFVDDIIGWDFVDNDNKPYDVASGALGSLLGGNPGHGTHCAGTIGAVGDNSVGISGVAPNVSIMPLRFLNDRGQGDTAGAVKAINYAVANGAKVLSNSWGSEGEEDGSGALKDAIKNAMDHDVLFIAAAGNGHMGFGYDNDSDSKPSYPASYNYANIISVAAVDKNDQLASFSNWGVKSVHIAAPGVGILSTMVGSRYSDHIFKLGNFQVSWEGTSMATPFVSGAAALVWAAHPNYKALDVKAKLLATVDKIPSLDGKVASGGRLNVAAAIK